MRDLPPTKMVKTEDHNPDFSSYDVVTVHDQMRLGQVFRIAQAASWTCCVVTTHPTYGEGLRVVGYRRTRAEAAERVVEAWLAPIDEQEAHFIVAAVQDGIQRAEEDVAKQLDARPNSRLTPGAFNYAMPFSVSTNRVIDDLATYRADLRNRLSGLKPAESYYLRHSAYMVRMAELELARREKGAQDALIPSGGYTEDEQSPYSRTWLWWDKRIAEIAEQLGQAQAHAIRRPNLQYKSVSDGELMEDAVFARRSLMRQRQRDHLDVDALRTAAFAYQLVLNASHERALQDEER